MIDCLNDKGQVKVCVRSSVYPTSASARPCVSLRYLCVSVSGEGERERARVYACVGGLAGVSYCLSLCLYVCMQK